MRGPISFGIGIGLTLSNNIGSLGSVTISGEPYAGRTLYVDNPQDAYFLMHLDELLLDDGSQLAYGAIPNSYQWKINGVDVPGATDVFFVIPNTVVSGDEISCNDSQPIIII